MNFYNLYKNFYFNFFLKTQEQGVRKNYDNFREVAFP